MGSVVPFTRAAAAPRGEAGDKTGTDIDPVVERARAGDVDAWALLYREHFDRLFNHIVYLTGDVQATEDLIQEAFARAFIGLRHFEGRASFVGWLQGIAINVVRKHWRTRQRSEQALDRLEVVINDSVGPSWADPEHTHLSQRRVAALLTVLDTLPAPLREAFVLCDFEDMPVREAAAQLGISSANLRVRATRARARIRGELIRLGWLPKPTTTNPEERDDVDR